MMPKALECKQPGATWRNADIVFCSIAYPAYDSLSPQEREYLRYRTRGFRFTSPRMYLKIVTVINEMLKEQSVKEDWAYIPVSENFHEGLECFGDMCHMYRAGIERKAEIIFQCLKERLTVVFDGAEPL
ncbi:MAG TPA: hypothetical protein PLO37_15925 [Candidatus Hydrogenedentes bacterium]|nr:hypothetical protein [Candidatus Hydrogenedentota bacterium]